jgi:glutamine amidotransferase
MINEFLAVRKQYPNGYAMFHARYATHGVKNEQNCHPFQVGGRTDTYLAHNGVLDIKINNGDKRSDTRVFAEDTLANIGGVPALDDENVLKLVSKWAVGSKIAILTLDPRAEYDCYIINEDAGHWDNDGNWWSNSTYVEQSWHSYWSTKADADYLSIDPHEKYECNLCGAVPYEDANPYYCEMCFGCYDCGGMQGDSCLCWTPEYDKQRAISRQAVIDYGF